MSHTPDIIGSAGGVAATDRTPPAERAAPTDLGAAATPAGGPGAGCQADAHRPFSLMP